MTGGMARRFTGEFFRTVRPAGDHICPQKGFCRAGPEKRVALRPARTAPTETSLKCNLML